MSASRVEAVETKPQTAPPRWKTEGDDYKADLTAHPEEIKELCPIVITTIDCRATKFKDADGKELTLQQVTPVKDENDKIIPNAYQDAAGRPVEAMDFEFDRTKAESDPNNDKAHFLVDIGVDKKKGLFSTYNVFEGRDVKGLGIKDEIDKKAALMFGGATHCMLYVHGFTVEPTHQIEEAMKINAKWQREGAKAFCVPVVWPAENPSNWSPRRVLDLAGYGTQKAGANGAARGLREEILPYLKHEVDDGTGKGNKIKNANTKISIMCHSMGNYVLKKMAPNKPAEEGGEKDKYINEQGERVDQKTDAFRFDNIFMVAADVRAVTFDETLGQETIKVDGKKVKDHDGKDILRLAKHKVHVCWHERDKALLVRRGTNWGRPALGKNGLESKYIDKLIPPGLDPKGKLVDKYCKEWADQKGGIRHGYQAIPDALDYYLKQMTANCDKC